MTGIIIVLVLLAIIQFAIIFVMRYAFRATNKRITNLMEDEAELHAKHAVKISLLTAGFERLDCVKKILAEAKKPEQTEKNKENNTCNKEDKTNTEQPSKPRTRQKRGKVKDN